MSNKVNKNKKIKNDQGEFQWESLILSTWIKKKKKKEETTPGSPTEVEENHS